jgi:putative transposase
MSGGAVAVLAPNHLQRQFNVAESKRVWVTDITNIRTHYGWLFLAAVLDLFSRQVNGWSMRPRIDRELAIIALVMAVWCRQPKETVMVHSDRGSNIAPMTIASCWTSLECGLPCPAREIATITRRWKVSGGT